MDDPIQRLNQFWYTAATLDATSKAVSRWAACGRLGAVKQGDADGGPLVPCKVALLSTPSLYSKLRDTSSGALDCTLFEFDRRFAEVCSCDRFYFFDYNNEPTTLPGALKGEFDLVICDPPFLSSECWGGFIKAAVWLARPCGSFLFCSIPENFPVLSNLLQECGRSDELRTLQFFPVQSGIVHRFRWFTTVAEHSTDQIDCPLCAKNEVDHETVDAKEKSDAEDDVLFGGLKDAVIAALLTE